MKVFLKIVLWLFALHAGFNFAEKTKQTLPEHLYQITLLRAYPGELAALINVVKQQKTQKNNQMVIMRHSQGDHWDLMLVSPTTINSLKPFSYQKHVNFQHDFIATSQNNWININKLSSNSNLFHIEMFNAARGLHKELLEQRKMENQYLVATKRNANIIFETVLGSDVDLFTVGFYPNMQVFAAEPDLDDSVFEKAAISAGFKSRSDIGLYLRRFLISHQDTLATQVK